MANSSFHVGNSGKLFGGNAGFDLSSATLLGMTLTDPDGAQKAIDAGRISAPASDAVFRENGVDTTYLANEYFQFTTIAADFDQAGQWKVCGKYTNTATDPDQEYFTVTKSFTVSPAC